MKITLARRTALLVALLACLTLSPATHAITIDWVTVGDPGNAADTTGFGAVATEFQIMKFEFTNAQYVDFLNAVDPNGTNQYSFYYTIMGSNARGGISYTSGAASGSKYAVKTNMGDKPVNYVTWFNAARVANWLENGATTSSSTETGAYTLVGGQTTGIAPAVNAGASYYIPTEDQWYKAAYYSPNYGGEGVAGYWLYATQSNTAPTPVLADTTGIGSAGPAGNYANWSRGADWNYQDGNVTTVGTNGGSSAYGAFDMNGNVREWNDLTGAANANRAHRGGDFYGTASNALSSQYSVQSSLAQTGYYNVGFRLAGPVAVVPEPSTWVMGAVGIAFGGLARYRRRRMPGQR